MVPPVSDSGLNANRKIGSPETLLGRESAQMIGFVVPFDEMLVKKPGDWTLPPTDVDEDTLVNATFGDVCTL